MRVALALLIVAAAAIPAGAQDKPAQSDEVLRQRLLLKERFNKGWDVQIENANDRIEGRCKAEAKKRFSAIHPIKRRRFTKDCIARAARR
jgi:hypothetical protein